MGNDMGPGTLLPHGGRLRAAAAHYRIPLTDWLDLSTGINPQGWPVPPVPDLWQRLPEEDDGLEQAAAHYYGNGALLPVAGSQAAIQALPRLRPPGRVGVIAPGYGEHAHAWRRTGHAVQLLPVAMIEAALPDLGVLVLIHPNNPTGARFARADLLRWRRVLAQRGGWLVIDEAFMDATPGESLATLGPLPGLVLLRSLGKFFGLAGARVGFVLADPALTQPLAAQLGPWTIAAPARWVATKALEDQTWQAAARAHLAAAGPRLAALLTRHGLPPQGGCALFQWVPTERAPLLHEHLARVGILTRLFEAPPAVRFGLPGSEDEWTRLADALGSTLVR
ncbi:threonine-phosphate decarboxylase CobD [uncultured Thiodictyon sp.]|jgi:cobalamin biosynthetic protein CobC|uniref:threonine-phosphate decarboxylase CobD n=1 Tax=uncultured Thiodictyon sp. TaxID=1846217 RepID=UPI0025CD3E30|nr:threonine-phosphate decarboxylase CobD [uncultured Thiodictyon sp.]